MKPIIGITASIELDEKNYFINRDNCRIIEESGGIPFILPHSLDEAVIQETAEKIDGLMLTGGNDIDPTYFSEEPHQKLGEINPTRDFFEDKIIRLMLAKDKPILGLCRGAQILNIVLNGSMYQDIYSQIDKQLLQHSQRAPISHGSHYVQVLENSLLHKIVGEDKLLVNSRHHQANNVAGDNMQYSALASDGVTEAIESTAHKFVLCVQWHPENLAIQANDQASKKIFKAFLKACEN